MCASGKNQSPVDLNHFIPAELAPLQLDYQTGSDKIINNGHTVQVNYHPGSTVSIDGRQFELKQYHFHTPGEHRIDGSAYPLEVHLVHQDNAGRLAVIGVMYQQGEANEALAELWADMPEDTNHRHPLTSHVSAADLLPASRAYYRYNGSLTTPPCSEGVHWLVMKDPLTASQAQITQLGERLQPPNNRPLQALNARPLLD